MNQDILKDLVTTSVSNDYDYDKVLAAFPELQSYDRQALQDYVQTAVDNDFKYDKVNKAFPEFFPEYATKKEKTSKDDTTTESESTVSTSEDGSLESQDQTETTEVEETETSKDPNFNEKADEYAKTKKDPNAPLTANELASMSEAKVSAYISKLAPGATVEETGFGNQVVVKMPGKESVTVDLSEFTGVFDETATSELQEILNLAEEQKNDAWATDFKPQQGTTDAASLGIQSKGGRYSEEQISVMNSTYSKAGYEFNMTNDGLALGFIPGFGSAEVEIKKDGEVVFTGTPQEVQDFMYSDINSREDKEELIASASEVRETAVTHLRNESEANANKKIQELVGDPNEVDKKTFREKGDDILASLDNEKNERFRFANLDDSSLKRIIAKVGASGGTNEEKIKLFNEAVEGRMLKAFELSKSNKLYKENADELPAIQEKIASLQNSFANTFKTPESTLDNQGNEIPGQSIVNKARTSFVSDFSNEAKSLSYEKILNDSGLGNIVLAQGVIDEKEAKVGLENVKKQREVLKTDVEAYQKQAKNKSDKLMANASKDGVTSVKFDEITKTYSVTANNEEVANRYEKELNSIASGLDAKFNQYTNGYNATESSYSSFAKQANDASLLQNVGSKDYNNINAIGYDIRNSFSGTWNSIGILFGSDRAEAAMDDESEQAAHYETMPEYTDVENFGGGLNFAARTLGQQSAPIVLAMATSGVGAGLGLTAGVSQTIVATTFGVSSAGGKKAELNKLQYDAYDAKIALDELELAKGNLDPEQYKRARKQLESTISLGNFSNWQKQSLIYSTGLIEGVTTRFLGTIPNVNKAWKSFANPVDDLVGAANRNVWQAAAHGTRKWGVAALGEIAEEEIIHFGTAGAESVILGTEFDPSGWDDVLVTSLITAGATNGPSTMYSTVMSHQVTSDLRNRFNLANDKVSRINDQIANLDPNSAQTKILREEKVAVMNGIAQLNSEMEMTAMMMGGKDAGQIVEVGNKLNELDQQAQVDPTAPENVQREQRNNYLNSLDAKDAKAFRSEYKILNDKKNKIQEKAIGSFDNAVNKIYGEKGQRILDKLIAKNPELKDASSRDQTIAVHEKVKDDNYKSEAANGRTVADNNPDLKAQVEQMVYGDVGFEGSTRKNRKKKEEDYYYAQIGRQNKRAQASGIVVNSEDNQNVAKILGDERMKNLVIKPAKTKQDVINQVSEAYDNVYNEEESAIDNGGKSKLFNGKDGKALDYSKIKSDEKQLFKERAKAKVDQDTDSIVKELISGQTNAAIVGGNYIVQGDVNTVAQQLAEGNILAGTAMSHEINHAVDARAFTTEGLNNYSSNLMEYMNDNHQDAHMSAMMTMNSNGYYNPNVSMDNQSDTFKDEYTKSIGDYFRSPQNQKEYNKLKKNTGQTLGNFARGVVGGRYKINTPKSAATYLVDFTEAMRKGTGLGDIQKRVIDNAKLDEDVSASTKRSANSPILHAKANDLGKKVNALYENKNSNPEYAFDIAKEYEGMVKKFLDRMELEGKWDLGQGETRTNNISDFIMNATLAERGVLGMVMGKGFKENEMVDVKDPKTGETVQEPNTISRYLNGTFPQRLTEFVGGTTIDPGIFKANLENMGELVSTERADKLTDEMVQEANNQFDTPLLSSLPFTQELLNDFRAEVAKTVGVKLPALDAKQGKNQSISPLMRELKKQFGVKNGPMHNVVKEIMGKTKGEVEAFLVDPDNKKAILEAMTTSWLASNLPIAVQKKVRGVGYTTDHVGRKKGTKPGDIEAWNASEDGPYKGMTDGKQKIKRNPNAASEVTNAQMLSKFAKGETMTAMNRAGLEKLQLAIAQELGLETFKADLLNNGELKEVFEDRQDLFDRVLADNFVEEFVRQSERGVTKRSANPNTQYSLGEEILDSYINNKGDRTAFEHEILLRKIPLSDVDNFDLEAIDKLMSSDVPAGYKQPLDAYAMEKGVSANVKGIIKEANDMGSFNQKDKEAGDRARVKSAEQVGKLVDALPLEVFASPVITPAFFGFSSSSRGFDTSSLNTKDYSPAAKKAMLDLESKINKRKKEASKLTTVGNLGFNPKHTRLFNAGIGLMGKIDNILNSNETAEQKRQAHNDQYGDEHNAANFANPLMLELVNNTFLDLAKTDRDAAVGWVYWNSMNTNNTSGPRSLSTWNLTQYENGPQGLYKGVNVKTGELEFFPSRAKAKSKVENGTIVDLEVNVDHPSYKVSEAIAEERANELVNEGKLEMEDIEKEIELMLFGGKGVKNWQGGLLRTKGEHVTASATTSAEIVIAGLKSLDNKNFDAKTEIKKLTQNFDQALGAKSLSDIQDRALGTTSRLGYGRVLALKAIPFTKLNSFKTLDGTTATDLAVDQFAKTDNIQAIENLKRSLNPITKQELKDVRTMDNTVRMSRTTMKSAKPRGMSTFDFDETLVIDGKNSITATKGEESIKINSEEFPLKGPELAEQGYKFDFSDFVNVKGGKEGPLMQKLRNQVSKYGVDNVFVLTARMQEAAPAIHAWLKSKGVDLKIENITGLGKSEGEAKALWMLGKFEEGYNDMYFVDDALPNVTAVKNVLDQLDIKSSVQIAKRSMNPKRELNFMLERSKGVDADETFNRVKARNKGIQNRKKQIFIPPSAEDFQGLMYYNMGKGVQGEADATLFKKIFYDPFNRADRELDMYGQTLREQVTSISKKLPKVRKKLRKDFAKTGYTNEQAMRIYLYDMNGHTVPGISEADQKKIASAVAVDSEMVLFANAMQDAIKIDGYIAPTNGWNVGSFNSDLADASKIKRTEYLQEWNDNIDAMFDTENLNKLEAVHGSAYRSALEDSIRRMKSGTNRPTIKDKKVNAFLDWTNGSVGAIMFFNARSAVLQTLSTVNFINFEDNNIFAASKAFANQKQFWTDFKMLYNSPMLKQRRGGLQTDVSSEELSRAQEQGGTKAVIAKLLQIGFTPTQIADSFAISAGGASFYRNRANKYLNEGFTQQEADNKAFDDFQEIAEQTQQSSRPDKISQEQASVLGRLILAFQNTPMQYNRLIKKAALDLINGRGSVKANVSRIIYYGAVQNLIFASLQNALFAAFGDDEEDEEFLDKKIERIANGTLDSLLRGSGIYGAIISTVKNTLLKWQEERAKGVKQDNAKVLVEALNVSPPIGSKIRKLNSALNTDKWNKQTYEKIPLYNIDNPIWDAGGHTIEAVTNIPLGRIQKKISNLKAASDNSNATWQRTALVLGWDKWGLGVDRPQEVEDAKQEAKEENRESKKEERKAREAEVNQEQEEKYLEDQKEEKKEDKKPRCAAATKSGGRCKGTPVDGTYCTIHARVEQRADGKDVQCKKIKSDGKRCGMQTSNKSGLCYYHD